MYRLDDYDYELPEALIAQQPAGCRDEARLLALDRATGRISHHRFTDICSFLAPGDALVVNDTAVVPCRLIGKKLTGGRVELLIINYAEGVAMGGAPNRLRFQCLLKAAKRPLPGAVLDFGPALRAEVVAFEEGVFTVDFHFEGRFEDLLMDRGKTPLPPYIRRPEGGRSPFDDACAYQTVYACERGAAAAPTAGLHFSTALLEKIRRHGVQVIHITLHVGYGTFVPVRVSDIREHRMHSETYHIGPDAADTINRTKAAGGRVVGVGTTSVRTLEYATDATGRLHPGRGRCDLFIYPGYRFKMVDAMITNFHLPRSTLLMLVSAFAGRRNVLSAYAEAVRRQYRFFSYGDAMVIG
jgi:S-adenosylmethionine:tRNA ribosyltransferase-isomerase